MSNKYCYYYYICCLAVIDFLWHHWDAIYLFLSNPTESFKNAPCFSRSSYATILIFFSSFAFGVFICFMNKNCLCSRTITNTWPITTKVKKVNEYGIY